MALITQNFPQGFGPGSQVGAAIALNNATALLLLTDVVAAAGTAIASTAAKAKTVNTVAYTIQGKFFSLSGTDNLWTLGGATSATVVAVNSFQKYLLMVDATQTASVQEGLQSTVSAAKVAWTNVAAYNPAGAYIAIVGSTKCVIGVLTVATDATHTFTPGTTNLNAAGITATFADGIEPSLFPLVANDYGNVVGSAS